MNVKKSNLSLFLFIPHILTSGLFSTLPFDLDYATFQSPENKIYFETYLLIPIDLFQTEETHSGYKIDANIRIIVLKDTLIVNADKYSVTHTFPNMLDLRSSKKIPQLSVFEITPGSYKLVVEIVDEIGGTSTKRIEDISISKFPEDELCMSDIELATSIRKIKKIESTFSKYGLEIIPNASNLFTLQTPMMYPYLEIYNISGAPSSYSIEYRILDHYMNCVMSRGPFNKVSSQPSSVEYTAINIVGFRTGKYMLVVEVVDKVSQKLISIEKPFFVYRKGETMELDSNLKGEIALYSNDRVDNYYDLVCYLSSEEEKKFYSSLNRNTKEEAIIKFFQKRNLGKPKVVNRYKLAIDKFYHIANEEFTTSNDKGWKTDRGKILIKYGQYEEIDKYPSGSDLFDLPYEIWYYYSLEGGVQFLFIDFQGFGNYQLVHSTHPDEVQNIRWQYILQDVQVNDIIKY